MSSGDKLPYDQALPIAQALAALLAPACHQIKIAGSIRRGKELVGDGEIVAEPKHFPEGNALWWVLDALVAEGVLTKAVIVDKNGKTTHRWGTEYRAVEYNGLKFDLFTAHKETFGYQYLLRTGPGDANTRLMQLVYKAPFKFEKGAAWFGEDQIALPDEQAVFELLGIAYISPDKRTPQAYERALSGKHQFPNPAAMLARQRVASTPWDERYKAGKDHVWVRQAQVTTHPGSEDGHAWHTTEIGYVRMPKLSPFAQAEARYLAGLGMPALRETYHREFKQWYKSELPCPGWIDVMDLPVSYLLEDGAAEEEAPLCNVAPTQSHVLARIVAEYLSAQDIWIDGEGKLPFGLRFGGSDKIYLIDGHHRWMAAQRRKIETFKIRVCTYPETLMQAMGLVDTEEVPADDTFILDVMDEVLQILAEAREAQYA